MIHSPLRLSDYFFTKILVEAGTSSDSNVSDQLPESKCEYMQHKEDSCKWLVTLSLKLEHCKGKLCPPYLYQIDIVGFFEVDKQLSEVQMENIVRVNAPAVLYGSAREMLINITSRGPFKALQLPTVTFIDQRKDSKEAKQPKKAQKRTQKPNMVPASNP